MTLFGVLYIVSAMSGVQEPPRAPVTATRLGIEGLGIDRASPIPLWFQIAQGIQDLIVGGALAPGAGLDNELQLGQQLGVSRPTMRRAMEHLVDQGLIVRRRGVGTRVVQPKVRRPLGLTSLFDDLAGDGQQPRTQVLTNEIIPADAQVASALALPEGADVIHLVRLRSTGEQPIAKMTNYLPAGRLRIPTEAVRDGGLYQQLRAAGVTLHAATQTIGARRATAEEARLLNETRGAALLTMQRTAYDDHGVPVEHGSHIYAANRYSFHTQMLTT